MNWLELVLAATLGAVASRLVSAYLPLPRRRATFSLARLTPMPLGRISGLPWYWALGVLPPGITPPSLPTFRSAGIYPAGLPIAVSGYAIFTLSLSFDTQGFMF